MKHYHMTVAVVNAIFAIGYKLSVDIFDIKLIL